MSVAALPDDLAQRSLSALWWTYAGAGGRAVTQLAIQVLLARSLGPEAFGQATAAIFVLSVGWLFAEGGFGTALVQRAQICDADIAQALGWMLLMSIGTAAVVVAFSEPIAIWLGDSRLSSLVLACGLLIPLQSVSNLPSSLMRRQLDMKRLQLIQLMAYVLGYGGVGLGAAAAGLGAWSLVLAFGAQTLIVLLATYACVRHPLRPRLRGDRTLRSFGFNVVGTNLANWAIESIDRVLVNRIWGAATLGEYTAASNLSRAPANLLVSSAQAVTLASASRVQDDKARLVRGYLAVGGLVWLISAPLFAWLSLQAEVVVAVLYGDRWQNAAPLFAAFCAGLPFYALLAITGPTLWAVGAVRSEFKSQVFIAACLLAGLLALRDLPLTTVVWLIPALYVLRLLMVYRSLALRIDLPHRRALEALLGGTLLAALAVLGWWIPHVAHLQGLSGALVSAAMTTALVCIALRLATQWVLPVQLRNALLARAVDSSGIQRMCTWLRIDRGAA